MGLSQRERICLVTLLAAAVFLRALLADGYMPDQDGGIRLCTPDGMVTVVIDPTTGEAVEVDESLSAECPWAYAFFPAAMPPGPPGLAVPYEPVSPPERFAAGRPAGQSVSLPPARAPPRILC